MAIPGVVEWKKVEAFLLKQQELAIQELAQAVDPPGMYRAQGTLFAVRRMLNLPNVLAAMEGHDEPTDSRPARRAG